jgi:hypothetical protein
MIQAEYVEKILPGTRSIASRFNTRTKGTFERRDPIVQTLFSSSSCGAVFLVAPTLPRVLLTRKAGQTRHSQTKVASATSDIRYCEHRDSLCSGVSWEVDTVERACRKVVTRNGIYRCMRRVVLQVSCAAMVCVRCRPPRREVVPLFLSKEIGKIARRPSTSTSDQRS